MNNTPSKYFSKKINANIGVCGLLFNRNITDVGWCATEPIYHVQNFQYGVRLNIDKYIFGTKVKNTYKSFLTLSYLISFYKEVNYKPNSCIILGYKSLFFNLIILNTSCLYSTKLQKSREVNILPYLEFGLLLFNRISIIGGVNIFPLKNYSTDIYDSYSYNENLWTFNFCYRL